MFIITCDSNGDNLELEDVVWWKGKLCHISELDDAGNVFIEEIYEAYLVPLDWVHCREVTLLTHEQYEAEFGETKRKGYATGGLVKKPSAEYIFSDEPADPSEIFIPAPLSSKLIHAGDLLKIGEFSLIINHRPIFGFGYDIEEGE